jgi:HSP20 family protein
LTTTSFAPPVDIYEDEHTITLKLEVPGIDEKDIDVRIEGNTLTVHGERKFEKERKRRTSVVSSGSTEASPARSRCPAR